MSAISSPKFSNPDEIRAIAEARHGNPFAFLGMHPVPGHGIAVRSFRPDALKLTVVAADGSGAEYPCERVHSDGFFEAVIEERSEPFSYKLRQQAHDGQVIEEADPYTFGNILGDQDAHYLGEGTHQQLFKVLGAHPRTMDGSQGTSFAVWAPNAQRVSVVADFNRWDGRAHPMRKRLECGVWEIFIPGVGSGIHYKYEIVGANGRLVLKSDPLAFFSQHGKETASITYDLKNYVWSDEAWLEQRAKTDLYSRPMSIYEVHLGSWKRVTEDGNRFLSYLEYAEQLVEYVLNLGFTHIELMPIAEFPFDGSWGYQVGSYFAPTSRFGTPDEFRSFVDRCHQRGLGVLVDWVPAHFPKDDHGLAKFDGTPLYEHSDPRQGEHRDWGTLIFNYGRNEVRSFLIANALFWFKEYHIDGLRVDAVASMLYLDYSREDGEWIPNTHGGRENLEAISFMRQLNEAVYRDHPGAMMIAEESTAWPGVSKPTSSGGLGFGFKWNMGWMNDFLTYMARDPIHRKHHHGEATFSMLYAFDENFILVLSHDEVVHGKGALLDKMPGDHWQKRANLRMFLAWMFTHPGKKLLFQGAELGQWQEWSHERSIDWHLLDFPEHKGIQNLIRDLNCAYRQRPALHATDHSPEGFRWLDASRAEDSIFPFVRIGPEGEQIYVVVNATPVPREKYRLGVREEGFYTELFNTDSEHYGGSGIGNLGGVKSQRTPWHGEPSSIEVTVPPLGALAFEMVQEPAADSE